MRTSQRALWLAALFMAITQACSLGGGGGPASSPGETPSAGEAQVSQPTEAPAPPTAPPSSGSGRVDSVNLCDILPPDEFAELAGGTPYSELTSPGPACSYVIDPGDGTAASYHTFLYTTETMRPVMDYVRDYEPADWIEGFGDSAYIQDAVGGDGFVLMILVEGQYGLEVGGPDKDVLQATARLIMERLGAG